MKVEVLFFAALREALGLERLELELPAGSDSAALRQMLAARGNEWAVLDTGRAVNTAVNQEMVRAARVLNEGDEVAFFPPVTGG